jgi:integrase/recombinase XerD
MPRKKETHSDRIEGNMSDPLGMGALLRDYLNSLQQRNYAEGTILKQRFAMNEFIVWAGERSLTRVSEVTRPVLERYQRHLYHQLDRHGNRLSFRNQHGRLSSIRSWFKWLARRRHVLYNPASELELPKLGHRLPRHVLSFREAEEVINGTTVTDPLGIRDRSILETFYSTGMRRLELINLQVYDVDTDRGVVSIRQGKGKKDRVIPIGKRALAWTEKYRHEVRPSLVVDPNETALYLTRMGEPFTVTPMSVLVRAYVDKAGIGKTGSCHLFRHTMATLMLENGADLRFIQAMLGHVKLDTTQIYTQVSIRKLKEIHEATHPARMEPEVKDEELEPEGDYDDKSEPNES